MFFKLVSRNSKRDRKENGLFFGSLLVSIVAFYIILSLSRQDVMVFLSKMESDAVDKLLAMIPAFYGMALLILFFLVYYASKFQLERRRHEFGVYLMMGMRRGRLFVMLLLEDFRNSVLSLLIGLPSAVLLSELISLVTARLVGLGIVGHKISFSLEGVLWTAAGFLLIKLIAFLILSGKVSRQEIGSLLTETPEGVKKQMHPLVYAASMSAGIACLAAAYAMAIRGDAWADLKTMGIALILGFLGTSLLFWGLRFPIGLAVRLGKGGRLHVFNFRQIQETVIRRSGTLAICSLLILAALCCFGAGVAISQFYGSAGQHVLDYTFEGKEDTEPSQQIYAESGDAESGQQEFGENENAEPGQQEFGENENAEPSQQEFGENENAEPGQQEFGENENIAAIRKTLAEYNLEGHFSHLFEMKVGHINTTDDMEHAFQMEPVMSALRELEPSKGRDVLLNNLSYTTYPYVVSLGSYNQLMDAAGLEKLELGESEAAVYMDSEYASFGGGKELLDGILGAAPKAWLDGKELSLTGEVQTTDLVTDCSITLSFALILPDKLFAYYTRGDYTGYLNGVLEKSASGDASLMSAISDMNQKLDETGLAYESYLQNMGRKLFYMVASSYITMYLAIIFLIVANTMVGVQFLISQQKSSRRYRALIHLGAAYRALCKSARKQINWYFGIPAAVAMFSSLFGIRALFTGILPSSAKTDLPRMMAVSAAMVFALCIAEYIYIAAVKRSSDHYLLGLMVPEREE